jgi:hypothetical protein
VAVPAVQAFTPRVTAHTRCSLCAPATVYSSGHSTAKPGPRPLAARLLPPTREREPRRNRRSSDIVGVHPYRPGRPSRRKYQGVRASRSAPSVWAEDPEASVSTRGLTFTPATPSQYAGPPVGGPPRTGGHPRQQESRGGKVGQDSSLSRRNTPQGRPAPKGCPVLTCPRILVCFSASDAAIHKSNSLAYSQTTS